EQVVFGDDGLHGAGELVRAAAGAGRDHELDGFRRLPGGLGRRNAKRRDEGRRSRQRLFHQHRFLLTFSRGAAADPAGVQLAAFIAPSLASLRRLRAIFAASSKAARVAPMFAMPFPAMSYAVPWAGVRTGMANPPSIVTPRSKPMSFIAICPWSWYMVRTASKAPALARRKTVSDGKGPSAAMPRALASSTAGAMTSISSRPKLPPSPACGLRPATAMRGLAKPASRMAPSARTRPLTTASRVMRR